MALKKRDGNPSLALPFDKRGAEAHLKKAKHGVMTNKCSITIQTWDGSGYYGRGYASKRTSCVSSVTAPDIYIEVRQSARCKVINELAL